MSPLRRRHRAIDDLAEANLKVSRRRAGPPWTLRSRTSSSALGEEGDAAFWRAAQTVRRARLVDMQLRPPGCRVDCWG